MSDNDTNATPTDQAPVETSPTPDSIPSAGPLSGPAPSDSPDTPTTGYMTLTGAPGNPGPNQTPADAAASQASQSAPPKSVWTQVVLGALAGLSGSGGKTFAEGVGRGAQAQLAQKQQQTENAQKAQQIQFESVKAADSHVAALNASRAADNENTEAQQRIADAADASEELLEEKGLVPKGTVQGSDTADLHAQASGMLQTLANANGGTVPQISTTIHPIATSTDGGTHQTKVYSTSPQDVTSNPNGVLDIINNARAVKGLPAMSQSDLQVAGGQLAKGNWRAGAAQIANDSTSFFTAIPALSKATNAKEIGAQNAAASANLQQQLDNYSQKPDADPKVVAALTTQKQAFDTMAENQRTKASANESKTVLEQAPAEADAAGQKAASEAKARLPYDLAKTKAEQAVKDGDPNAAGQLLANGDVAPSQIISARNPAFAQKAFSAAKAADPNWNAQQAEGYFKAASAPANVTFYGSANSLLDKGGTIDQTRAAYDALPNGQIPAINGAVNWADKTIGGKAPSGFAATALGLADDYSKVMTGGQGSDSSRNEILQTLVSSASPAQMQQTLSNMRAAVQSQVGGRVGTNPVAKRMYGYNLPESPQTGEHAVQDKTGRTIGYTTDGKTMRPL